MPPKKGNKRAGKPRPTLLAKGINSLSHAKVSQSCQQEQRMTMRVRWDGGGLGWALGLGSAGRKGAKS